ncbi:hypothetical protein [Roseibium salinum]|uniref:Uncharacterized protein n=1 Tax=Roseibium salinum TaxID=1604349 RepID=A0ABT3R0C1_9HYPH|nr:hypothetical protein [Roseibium sp. DSM 29163]MCX2722679.1 hypothetical protein [Roseibium sp. DSM 29163]
MGLQIRLPKAALPALVLSPALFPWHFKRAFCLFLNCRIALAGQMAGTGFCRFP